MQNFLKTLTDFVISLKMKMTVTQTLVKMEELVRMKLTATLVIVFLENVNVDQNIVLKLEQEMEQVNI